MTSVESNSATINISNTNNNTTILNMSASISSLGENETHSVIKRFKADHLPSDQTSQNNSNGRELSPDQLKQIKSLSNATNFKNQTFKDIIKVEKSDMMNYQTNAIKNINTNTYHPYNSKFYKNRVMTNNYYTGKPTEIQQQPASNSELLQQLYNNQTYPKINNIRQYSQYNEHVSLNSDDETLITMHVSDTDSSSNKNISNSYADEDEEDNMIESNDNHNLNPNSLTNQVFLQI